MDVNEALATDLEDVLLVERPAFGSDEEARLVQALLADPSAQRQGIGAHLIAEGASLLAESGVELLFVLGHPEYYPRHGFEPATRLGLKTGYAGSEVTSAGAVAPARSSRSTA